MVRRALLAMALLLGGEPGASAREPERLPDRAVALSAGDITLDAGLGAGTATLREQAGRLPLPRSAGSSADPWSMTEDELARLVEADLSALGSLSLGRPNAGALLGAVRMPEGPAWEIVDPKRSWATQETVDYLVATIGSLRRQVPDAPRVFVGDLSREQGGALGPHRSHQSGRDVDLGYIYKPGMHVWYQRASGRSLDVPKTWALVRALVTETDVEMLFMDLGVQKLLKEHALAQGESRTWLDSLFRFGSTHPAPLVRQAWGHSSHMHVRFFNPRAQTLGFRCHDALVAHGIIAPEQRIVRYVARAGDSLGSLAGRAGSSPVTIRQLNAMTSDELRPGRTYLVPLRGRVAQVRELRLEPRRLPPDQHAAMPQLSAAGLSTAPGTEPHASL